MNIQQLRYVVAIANSGTFREAASKLFVSQPSLSVAIKDLEQELNFQIFTRTTTGAVLTSQGMTFYERALEVVRSFDSFENRYLNASEKGNQYSIASQHYDFLPPLITTFSERYPDYKDFRIFESTTIQILDEVAKAGYLSPKAVFIDGTHIKANANTKKQMKEQIPAAARHYAKELMEEVNADREAHDKKPFDDDNDPPASPRKHKDNTSKKKLARRKKQGFRTVTKSVTDPDCGLFVKGEHKRQFAYEAHTACDKNGFVLETVVTPGNVHDSVAFDEVYDKVTENFPQVEAVVADAAYKTPHICKKVFGDGRVLSTAYKRPQTMKNGHEWWKYVYDEFYNCVICPEYQPLKYSTTNRDGYREYKSDPNICAACPTRERCTHSRDCIKTVQRHIWKDYEELADDARYTPAYAQLYKCRKETIERVFADAKEKHAMRYTQYRGLAQVTNWVKLKFVAMNLKKLATWKWRDLLSSFRFAVFSLIYVRDPVCS